MKNLIAILAFISYSLVFAGGIAWAIIKDKVAGLEDYLKQKEMDRMVSGYDDFNWVKGK